MLYYPKRILASFLPLLICCFSSHAEYPIKYDLSTQVTAGGGDFTPYYIASNNHGVTSLTPNSGYLRASLEKETEKSKPFSYGFGADIIGAYRSYSACWIQQLYAEIKYRCLTLTVGSKEYNGEMKNRQLSSGSMVWSGNARPIPQIRISIPEFVAVPFTNGWLQLKGDISYGLFTDNRYLEKNFYSNNSYICTDAYYHQKKIFFRSKESQPFIVTIGAELAAQFGGTKYTTFPDGTSQTDTYSLKPRDFWNVLFPGKGGEHTAAGDQAYYFGNHLGVWHAIFEYKLKNKSKIKGYFEWFFEDASGMGKLNGGDGLWGLEYTAGKNSLFSEIVLEYIQTTNQSGPIHWNPDDTPGTGLTGVHATGSDDYYNNFYYNGWAQYGMALGSPMLKSPGYNKDGYLRFTDNRIKGVHIGLSGYIIPELKYRFLASYRKSWGTPFIPVLRPVDDLSLLLEVNYTPKRLKSWSFTGNIGIDRGKLYGNNTGVSIGISKTGYLFTR